MSATGPLPLNCDLRWAQSWGPGKPPGRLWGPGAQPLGGRPGEAWGDLCAVGWRAGGHRPKNPQLPMTGRGLYCSSRGLDVALNSLQWGPREGSGGSAAHFTCSPAARGAESVSGWPWSPGPSSWGSPGRRGSLGMSEHKPTG